MGSKWVWSVVALAALLIPRAAYAGDMRDNLKGVKDFTVQTYTHKNLTALGITEERISTAVQAALRKARLPLVENDDGTRPTLVVSIEGFRTDDGLTVYAISLQFFQSVGILRDPPTFTRAITWNGGNFGIVGARKVDTIKDTVIEQLDKFINDYLAANPGK